MINVYYLDIGKLNMPNLIDFNSLPLNRKNYILSINDKKIQKQSYYVFKLLLKVLQLNGIKNSSEFVVNDNIWQLKTKDINFSLSHSYNIVALATSADFVGIDVEKIDEKILKVEKLFNSISNDNSLNNLTRLWTEKESLYKLNSIINLKDNNIKINNENCFFNSMMVTDKDNFNYFITVSSVKNYKCKFIKMQL